jgi:hypothetical protein
MNKNIMKAMGFGKEVKLAESGKCPFCEKTIDVNEFRDELSKKEFGISGLCQTCQDEVF